MMKSITILLAVLLSISIQAQSFITNVPARKQQSLNGKWQAIVDPTDAGIGSWTALYKDKKPIGKTDFYEYSFDGSPQFDVPGDFNSQLPELKFYESTVWYKKTFNYAKPVGKRLFMYFDAVNYQADIYLNGQHLGRHDGGFTPFQFEISDQVKEGSYSVIVRVNNQRQKDGVPSLGYDWLNYGGITRDVRLIETPISYIDDYFVQFQKGSKNLVNGFVRLAGATISEKVRLRIPEANIDLTVETDANGYAALRFPAKLKLWSPESPKLYKVFIQSVSDTISEEIGFRTIETKNGDILLNGTPIFLKGINFHEEVPQRKGRAYSETDARMTLTWAKELGCNFIRTAHYPQNENVVRLAEKMGFMVWEEIPVFQGISFGNAPTRQLMDQQLKEMLRRDKNRCGIIIWSMSNETAPNAIRTEALSGLAKLCRSMDSTRLLASAFNNQRIKGNQVILEDSLINALDVIGVNEYIGWYNKWPAAPEAMEWVYKYDKPLIMSEFGAEALYGNHGPSDVASSWSEEYQEKLYKDQLVMMSKIPSLRGCSPWILADFQSPKRMHPVFQNGWNRKGLLSEKGEKKKAWYVMNAFYKKR